MKRRALTEGRGSGPQMFHEKVDQLADEIQEMDRMRLLEPTSLPKVLRGYRRRPQPSTAIISYAAQRAYERRMAVAEDDRDMREAMRKHFTAHERMLNRIARKLRFRVE